MVRLFEVRLSTLIPALGIAQIISWGTLYYSIAVLGENIGRDLRLSDSWVFGAFTLGLLASGVASPLAGRLVDRKGGRFVLSGGSVVGAVALFVLALANGPITLVVG